MNSGSFRPGTGSIRKKGVMNTAYSEKTGTSGGLSIRRSTEEDIPRMMEIFAAARDFMRRTGNPDQWSEDYPDRAMLLADIAEGSSHLVLKDGKTVATFVLRGGIDPTYLEIRGGWLDERPYGTIHRIAGDGTVRGILHLAVGYALESFPTVRIDTHRDNRVMRNALAKEGFRYCGIINCWNGDERLAFQLP
ncbi:MAG: GNAT family N-acetyltransferase [Candidatus Cryptobacteroides sp.]